MCSESLPKEFEKSSQVLPFTKYGISSYKEFKKIEEDLQHHEWLKKVGLTSEEIKLYKENESGVLEHRNKVESNILQKKLQSIYNKVNDFKEAGGSKQQDEEPNTSKADIFERLKNKPMPFYPDGHPMNELKEIEDSLFGHLKDIDMLPITKRRKILRRFERKKARILEQKKQLVSTISSTSRPQPGSLWDVKEIKARIQTVQQNCLIGPKKQTMYTIKDKKIVRLEPMRDDRQEGFKAVDIVMPINPAEEQMLEGTKMCLDDIKKIERFKDYEPGTPSKVLYLKNIAPPVTQEQLSLLFNQFVLENGGPIDLRLMSGKMRGQAFVAFQNEDLAIRALDEINGTILSGRPVIAQFGRNSNRINDENS